MFIRQNDIRLAIQVNAPFVGLMHTRENVHERAFARAVFPNERVHLSGPHFKIHSIQRLHAAEPFPNSVHGQERAHCFTGFSNTPIPSISRRTTSPGSKKICGLRNTPTPAGVPVLTTSPGSRVMTRDKKLNNRGSGNTQSAVDPSCMSLPLT